MKLHMAPFLFFVGVATTSVLHSQAQCPAKDVVSGFVEDATQAGVPANMRFVGRAPFDTDAVGRFQLTCVPEGAITLVVQAPGFEDKTVSLVKGKDALTKVDIVLAVAAVQTNIEVNGDDSATANDASVASSNLDKREIDALPDDPDQFEEQLRALASAGGGPEGVLITVDGFQSSSAIPPKSSIDHVKINPSPFSAEYGSVLWPGGRIEIYTKPGATAFHGSVFANDGLRTLNASDPFSTAAAPTGNKRFGFDLTGPLMSKMSFVLALEKRNIDEQSVTDATVLGSNGVGTPFQTTVAAPQRLWIGSARIDWQAAKNNIATASFSANNDSAENQGVGG